MQVNLLDTGRPLDPRQTVAAFEHGARLAYHGIVSRGLVDAAAWWPGLAPVIEDVWNAHAERDSVRDDLMRHAEATLRRLRGRGWNAASPESLGSVIDAARSAGVLSVSQAALVAEDFLLHDGARALRVCAGDADEVEVLDLDRVKEGHTASVFQVTARRRGAVMAQFGLQVARDLSGARDELAANARDLAHWARRAPDQCAAVLDVGEGHCRWFGRSLAVPVAAVGWLDGYDELHVLRDGDGRGRVARVAQFVARPGERLPLITGHVLDSAASDEVWASVVALRTRLADLDWQRDAAAAPAIELNEGDLVGRFQGHTIRVALVGADPEPWRGSIGRWLYEAALSHARADLSALRWARPDRAVDAVLRATDPARRRELLCRAQGAAADALAECSDDDARQLAAETARIIGARACS